MNVNMLSAPKSESDVTSFWKYSDKIYVSFICISFNQVEYIAGALESLLAQKCKYRFEILVHDDCSTDGTKAIIEGYKARFPSIINFISQNENQFSKGKKIFPIAIEHCNGEFVAFCEADDYWVDEFKAEKQLEACLAQKASLCVTKSLELNEDTGEQLTLLDNVSGSSIRLNDIIRLRGAGVATASMMCRKSSLDVYMAHSDRFIVSDYFIQVLCSVDANCAFVPEVTSVYRRNAAGSWTQSQKSNRQKIYRYQIEMVKSVAFLSELILQKETRAALTSIFYFYYLPAAKGALKFGSLNDFIQLLKLPIKMMLLNIKRKKYEL